MIFRFIVFVFCLFATSCESPKEKSVASKSMSAKHLEELKWLIGKWSESAQDSKVETSFEWDMQDSFIIQNFKILLDKEKEFQGKQVIGWDPIKKTIRSWIFDSDGGFGEGTWKKVGNSFTVEVLKTLPDGRKSSAIFSYTPVENGYQWASTGRAVGGDLLPDVGPITVKRKGT